MDLLVKSNNERLKSAIIIRGFLLKKPVILNVTSVTFTREKTITENTHII